jgi:hypothetical protein
MQAPYYHEGSNCDLGGFIASPTVRAPTPGMIHYSVPVSVLYKPSLDYTIHVFPQISSTASSLGHHLFPLYPLALYRLFDSHTVKTPLNLICQMLLRIHSQ